MIKKGLRRAVIDLTATVSYHPGQVLSETPSLFERIIRNYELVFFIQSSRHKGGGKLGGRPGQHLRWGGN